MRSCVKPKEVSQESLHLAVFPVADHELLRVGLIRGDAHPQVGDMASQSGQDRTGDRLLARDDLLGQSAPSRTRTVTW